MVKLKPKSDRERETPGVNYDRSFRFKHLLWFILGSAIAHSLIFLLLTRYKFTQPVSKLEDSKPIEFVVVPPEEESEEPPPETNNRAAENSTAQPNTQPEKIPTSDELGEEIEPEPELAPAPTPTPAPAPAPAPAPEPETSAKDLMSGENPPTPEPETTVEEPVATRLPPEPEPPPETDPGTGSAADLLGGDYKKTLADGGADAFFSPEALTHKTVLNPGQIDALKDVDLSAYFNELRRRVKQNWNPSYSSSELTTYLTFNIQKNGQITGLRVKKSSGSEKLDRESLAAVQNSAPLDPLPPDFPLEALEIEFSFNIYLYQ